MSNQMIVTRRTGIPECFQRSGVRICRLNKKGAMDNVALFLEEINITTLIDYLITKEIIFDWDSACEMPEATLEMLIEMWEGGLLVGLNPPDKKHPK